MLCIRQMTFPTAWLSNSILTLSTRNKRRRQATATRLRILNEIWSQRRRLEVMEMQWDSDGSWLPKVVIKAATVIISQEPRIIAEDMAHAIIQLDKETRECWVMVLERHKISSWAEPLVNLIGCKYIIRLFLLRTLKTQGKSDSILFFNVYYFYFSISNFIYPFFIATFISKTTWNFLVLAACTPEV